VEYARLRPVIVRINVRGDADQSVKRFSDGDGVHHAKYIFRYARGSTSRNQRYHDHVHPSV